MSAQDDRGPALALKKTAHIWSGRRFELRTCVTTHAAPFHWDFEFVDRAEKTTVAYIKETSGAGYEVHLTIPNTDPYRMESITQICSEVPKLIRAYLGSKRSI